MRVEAAKRALDLQPGRDDHPIDIDRPGAQSQPWQQVAHHRRIEGLQAADGRHREVGQPPTQRPRGRHHADPREALEDRVVRHVRQMAQAAAADDHQPDHQPHHRDDPEVAPPRAAGPRLAHLSVEVDAPHVAREQLQPRVRREGDVIEFQRKIPIDTGAQIGSSSSHVWWPFVGGRNGWVTPPFNHNGRPFSITKCHSWLNGMSH